MSTHKNGEHRRVLVIVLLAVFILSAALLAVHLWENGQSFDSGQGENGLSNEISYRGTNYVLREDIETLLIMGLDKYADEVEKDAYYNDQSADFILLLCIDNASDRCTALHINRDTMADMNRLGLAGEKIGSVHQQIALSHTYGNGREVSCRNVCDAVFGLLYGVEIRHFLSLTMDAVPALTDMLGGVEVTLLEDFSHEDAAMTKGTTLRLSGEQALIYTRYRQGLADSSNLARMERQRQFMQALIGSVRTSIQNDTEFSARAAAEIADFIVSDCSVTRLQSIFDKVSDYEFAEVQTLEGEAVVVDEHMQFHPDEDSLMETVLELFYKEKV